MDSPELLNRFYHWLQVQFKNFNLGYDDLSREKNKVRLVYGGIDHVFEFVGDEKVSKKFLFNVYILKGDENLRGAVCTAIENREKTREGKTANRYKKIFKESSVSLEKVCYNGDYYDAVKISTPVREVPRGSEGGLSESLFEYGRREIFGVAHSEAQRRKGNAL